MISAWIKEALKDFWRKSKFEQGMDGVLEIRDRFMQRVTDKDEPQVK